MSPIHPDDPEARAWLRTNPNKDELAGIRFDSSADALEFVEQLYAAGAIRVVVPRESILAEPWRIAQEGGPYADALAFEVGPDHDGPGIRELIVAELEHEVFDEDAKGEGELLGQGRYGYFWWD